MRLPARLGAVVTVAALLAAVLVTPGLGQTPTPGATETATPSETATPAEAQTPAATASPCPAASPSSEATESAAPSPGETGGAEPSPTPETTASPSESPAAATESPAAATESPAAAACPPEEVKPGRTTDTEYLKVRMNAFGAPKEVWLKDWIRLRGTGNRRVVDPGIFASVRGLSGSSPGVQPDTITFETGIGGDGVKDLYYEGRVQQAGDEFVTPAGLSDLPIRVTIRYFTGPEGAEQETPPKAIVAGSRPTRFKMAITVTNTTRRMEEVPYTDIQTKKQVIGVAPVYTPFVARVVDLRFPDSDYDQIRADGDVTRSGSTTLVNWAMNLVPPDFPAEQTATVTGVVAKGGKLPQIDVVAQPVFPPLVAEPLTSSGVQFERGRRNFFYDVFGLFRDNLVALTGLFGLLHDAFGNLSIPILGPDKNNREACQNGGNFDCFDNPNQLWALWTLTKGMEQLDRAMNVLDNGVQIARDGMKGAIGSLSAMRLFLGFSTDPPATNAIPGALSAGSFPSSNDLTLNSIWSDVKQIMQLCGETGPAVTGTQPYFPALPVVTVPLCPDTAVYFNLLLLKMGLMEHDLHSIQKENHVLDTALLGGLSSLPAASGNPICSGNTTAAGRDTPAGAQCDSYNKFTFIKFPFGLEEIERGLYTIKVHGFDPLQAALGNKDTPNSLIWALHVLTDGAQAQVDAFHNLGSTWRYIADSIQNFAIFGVETSRNILQWDVNAIDLNTGVKAAAVRRAQELGTFMGRPTDPDGQPAVGQLVVSFSTGPVAERPHAVDSARGRVAVAFGAALILVVLFGFARFRWFLI
jgi:hypothetical protein